MPLAKGAPASNCLDLVSIVADIVFVVIRCSPQIGCAGLLQVTMHARTLLCAVAESVLCAEQCGLSRVRIGGGVVGVGSELGSGL